jgi:hypothetical protein
VDVVLAWRDASDPRVVAVRACSGTVVVAAAYRAARPPLFRGGRRRAPMPDPYASAPCSTGPRSSTSPSSSIGATGASRALEPDRSARVPARRAPGPRSARRGHARDPARRDARAGPARSARTWPRTLSVSRQASRSSAPDRSRRSRSRLASRRSTTRAGFPDPRCAAAPSAGEWPELVLDRGPRAQGPIGEAPPLDVRRAFLREPCVGRARRVVHSTSRRRDDDAHAARACARATGSPGTSPRSSTTHRGSGHELVRERSGHVARPRRSAPVAS